MGRIAEPLVFKFLIPETTVQWPFTAEVSVADPKFPDRDVRLGTLRVSIGVDILSLGSSASLHFLDTAPLEPCLIAQTYRAQIDYVEIIHQTGDPDFIGGKVTLFGGYNIDVLT